MYSTGKVVMSEFLVPLKSEPNYQVANLVKSEIWMHPVFPVLAVVVVEAS